MKKENKIVFFIYLKDNREDEILAMITRLASSLSICVDTFFLKRDNNGFFFINKAPDDAIVYDLAVSIGGDGTFLFTVSYFYGKKILFLPVNKGNLGFLTWVSIDEIKEMLEDYINGNFTVEKRLTLQIDVNIDNGRNSYEVKSSTRFYALNEVAISKFEFATPLQVKIKIDDKDLLDYMGDGIIVATPTGSTGYSLSAGGPIVCPLLDCLIITPICPHSLTIKPVVIEKEHKIEIFVLNNRKITITADGQRGLSFTGGVKHSIVVKNSDYTVSLLKTKSISFFDIISKKLNWGL